MSAVSAEPADPSAVPLLAARPRLARLVVPVGLAAALFALALAARLAGVTLFVTPDEDNWMRRTGNFAQALERGRLAPTYQSGHPGVTTMWVAWLGIGPAASGLAGVTGPDVVVTRLPEFGELLVRARMAFVAVNSALVVLIALLTWRLVGPGPALLGGVLLALDPFFAAHGQVVHLDALSAGLIAVALLAGAVYWWAGGAGGYLVLCGAASGLAVLTKAPSLFLGLFLPALAVVAYLRGVGDSSWRRLVVSLGVVGVAGLVTVFAAWPAMWGTPIETVRRAIDFQLATAGTPHTPGNFFLGRAVADPGPLFYPIAVAFRVTPAVFVGLLALVLFPPTEGLRWHAVRSSAGRSAALTAAILVVFAIGFGLFLTTASKKLDRYALPLFPILAILAGIGLWTVAIRLRSRAGRIVVGCLLVGAVAIQGLSFLSAYPYPLAYYNPLVGGGAAARRTILVGWGEGLDQAAAYLRAQPDAEAATIAIYFPHARNFQAISPGTVQQFGHVRPADYVVDYVSAAQRGQTPPEILNLAPERTVVINGIVYARVYRLNPPRLVRSAGTVDRASGRADPT